jgi:glucokinase
MTSSHLSTERLFHNEVRETNCSAVLNKSSQFSMSLLTALGEVSVSVLNRGRVYIAGGSSNRRLATHFQFWVLY